MMLAVASLLPVSAMVVLHPWQTHAITAILVGYILLTTTPANWKPASHMCHPDLQIDEYSWFFVVKKLGVAAAYAACLLMSALPGSKAVGSLFSLGLVLNVIMCIVLTAIENDWVVCIAMLILAPFYPVHFVSAVSDEWTRGPGEWTHVEANQMCGVFPICMRMNARTYMRWYFVVFSAFHLFTDHFGGAAGWCGTRINFASGCYLSLLSMEVADALGRSKRSPCRYFMIRGMGEFCHQFIPVQLARGKFYVVRTTYSG